MQTSLPGNVKILECEHGRLITNNIPISFFNAFEIDRNGFSKNWFTHSHLQLWHFVLKGKNWGIVEKNDEYNIYCQDKLLPQKLESTEIYE